MEEFPYLLSKVDGSAWELQPHSHGDPKLQEEKEYALRDFMWINN